MVEIKDGMTDEEYYEVASSLKTDLKLLTVNEIIEKIKNGDKDFSNVRIVGVDWARRDLSGFNFSGSKLEWNIFNGCKLDKANFSRTFINLCDFSNADLKNAVFVKARIWSVIFEGSIIDDANFSNSDLRNVIFANCNIHAANFSNITKLRMWTSWEEIERELKDEDLEVVLRILEMYNLPSSVVMKIKSLLANVKSKTEKLKLFYSLGHEFINPKGSLYDFPKISDEQLVGGGVYVKSDKEGYGIHKRKDEDISYTERSGYKPRRK